MPRPLLALLALLLLAVAVAAIEIDRAQEVTNEFLNNVKATLRISQIAAIGIMLATAIYHLFITREGVHQLFRSAWFLIPLLFVALAIALNIAAIVAPEFRPIYEVIKQGECPFLYCP